MLYRDVTCDKTIGLIFTEVIIVGIVLMRHRTYNQNRCRMLRLRIIDITCHGVVVVLLKSDDDRDAAV